MGISVAGDSLLVRGRKLAKPGMMSDLDAPKDGQWHDIKASDQPLKARWTGSVWELEAQDVAIILPSMCISYTPPAAAGATCNESCPAVGTADADTKAAGGGGVTGGGTYNITVGRSNPCP